MMKNKDKKNKSNSNEGFFKKSKTKIINFTKLIWSVVTYKFLLLIVAVAIVAFFYSSYKSSITRKINRNTEANVKSLTKECLEKIQLKINDEFNILETLSMLYDGDENISLSVTESLYSDEMASHHLVGIELLTASNETIIQVGTLVNYEEDVFIESVLSGENTVSSIVFDKDKNEYICLGVPIYKDNTIIGAIVGEYNIKEFTEILDTSSFGKVGSIFIAEEDGTLVARPETVGENTNLFSLLDSININSEKKIDQLKKNIVYGNSGVITYGNDKYKRYICYDVIPDTDWYAVSIVSESSMDKTMQKVSRSCMYFSIKVAFVFVLYIFITIGIDIKILKKKEKSINELKNE